MEQMTFEFTYFIFVDYELM